MAGPAKATDMRRGLGAILDALRQPAYTGENRCIPCTAVNVVIALGLAAGLGIAAPLGPAGSAGVGAAVLVVSAAAIWLRGYLVPGTPWLTRTYFPDRILRYFGHHEPDDVPGATGASVDPEAVLIEAGALTECDDRDDLCLTAEFRAAWHERIDALRGSEASRTDLAELLGLPASALEFKDHGSAFEARAAPDAIGTPQSRTRRVGQWESEGAFIADMAAARVLDGRVDAWDALPAPQRGQVLNGLRVFLDACPSCGGAVTFGEETVMSCCTGVDVVAVTCEDCGDRLFEARQPGQV